MVNWFRNGHITVIVTILSPEPYPEIRVWYPEIRVWYPENRVWYSEYGEPYPDFRVWY